MMPHGFLEPERLKISRAKKLLIGALVERKNLNSAAGIVATSDAEATGFVRYGLKRPVHVMPIGIDFEKYGSRGGAAECSPSAARKRLLYFSRITPVKGLDLLAEAWRRLASFHAAWELLIVGPDDRGYSKVVEALFERLSPDGSVHFVAPVYGDSKYALLNSADAFVLPTRSENWGIAVAEAMASGLPIVCTKGAPWKCIETCGCGYWVDVSVAGICDGLSKVLSSADSVRMAMGQRGMAWVRDNLCWDRIADGVIGFYEKLLGIGSRG